MWPDSSDEEVVNGMCGLVASISREDNSQFVVDALRRLNYRGYDSFGIDASQNCDIVASVRQLGAIPESFALSRSANIVLGHTRWSSQGKPTLRNAHPIVKTKVTHDQGGRIERTCRVVHNGIIENYGELRSILEERGWKFETETDTEVIPCLLLDEPDHLWTVSQMLKGEYAFVALIDDHLLAIANGSPLVISNRGHIASDPIAFSGYADKYVRLLDGQFAYMTDDLVTFCHPDGEWYRPTFSLDVPNHSVNSGPAMLREIFEQPETLSKLPQISCMPDGPAVFFGCGSSYHAALLGRLYWGYYKGHPAQAEYASEFAYVYPTESNFIGLTQSGETKDTLNAFDSLSSLSAGRKVVAITNNPNSTVSSVVDHIFGLGVGPEIGVAATKTFTAQCLALLSMSVWPRQYEELKAELIPAITNVLTLDIEPFARELARYNHVLCLARRWNLPAAMEGALKIKEVAYIHAEAMSSAEMKHGPIALIDEKTLSIFIVMDDWNTKDKVISNMREIKARDGRILLITDDASLHKELYDWVILIPKVSMPLQPIVVSVVFQLLAYWAGTIRGNNVDRPRSLCKSVTVE